jgi:hypothetical protein
MNIYLLQLIAKWVGVLFMSFVSLFDMSGYNEKSLEVSNLNFRKSSDIVNQVISYDTKYIYNSNLSSDTKLVRQAGENGIVYVGTNGTENIIVKNMVSEIIEIGTGPLNQYIGTLTGYGPDCPGCSAVGNVACRTREKTKHSLITNGTTYVDTQFGELRILAAAHEKFPCGTVMEVNNGRGEVFTGIVLDTGGTMRQAWKNNTVWVDLAFSSQAEAAKAAVTSRNTTYNVKRYGW